MSTIPLFLNLSAILVVNKSTAMIFYQTTILPERTPIMNLFVTKVQFVFVVKYIEVFLKTLPTLATIAGRTFLDVIVYNLLHWRKHLPGEIVLLDKN